MKDLNQFEQLQQNIQQRKENILKSFQNDLEKAGHKYTKRTGSPGHYRYEYEGDSKEQGTKTKSSKKESDSLGIGSTSIEDQRKWSKKKTRLYDVYVSAHNVLEDLKDELKQAKDKKDTYEIGKIQEKIAEKQWMKEAAKKEFKKID